MSSTVDVDVDDSSAKLVVGITVMTVVVEPARRTSRAISTTPSANRALFMFIVIMVAVKFSNL